VIIKKDLFADVIEALDVFEPNDTFFI